MILLAAGPTRAGTIGPPPEPEPFVPEAVLYSLDAGLLLLVPLDFDLEDLPSPVPSGLALVALDDLTHGSADWVAIAKFCVSDPACRDNIRGSGPLGSQALAAALLDTYGSISNGSEPPNGLPVPEPYTAMLLGLGLGVLALAARRAGSRQAKPVR